MYAEYIAFPYKRLLTFSLAGKLVYENEELYNQDLAVRIAALSGDLRLPVLKWCAFNAVKVGQFSFFQSQGKIPLALSDKAVYLNFLGDLLKHTNCLSSEISPPNLFFGRQQEMISYFLGAEYLASGYITVLEGWLAFILHDISKVWVYTSLAMNCLLQLDSAGLEKCLHELRQLPDWIYDPLPIHPLHCLETLYTYLKYGTVRKAPLKQITAYYFNPPVNKEIQRPEYQLLFVLGLHTLKICNHPVKQLRLIKAFENNQAKDIGTNAGFDFFVAVIKAEACLATGKQERAETLYNVLAEAADTDQKSYTAYMKIRLDLLHLKTLTSSRHWEEAGQALEQLIVTSEKYGYYEVEIEAIATYFGSLPANLSPEFVKRIHYRYMRTIRRSGFSPQSFPLPEGMPDESLIAV